MPVPPRHYDELFRLFAAIEDPADARQLLTDLLTPQELDSLAERWQLVQALLKGEPQREIAQRLNVSISKITRGSRALQYGTGSFARFLKKLAKDNGSKR